jgi:hypothetical protein
MASRDDSVSQILQDLLFAGADPKLICDGGTVFPLCAKAVRLRRALVGRRRAFNGRC